MVGMENELDTSAALADEETNGREETVGMKWLGKKFA